MKYEEYLNKINSINDDEINKNTHLNTKDIDDAIGKFYKNNDDKIVEIDSQLSDKLVFNKRDVKCDNDIQSGNNALYQDIDKKAKENND